MIQIVSGSIVQFMVWFIQALQFKQGKVTASHSSKLFCVWARARVRAHVFAFIFLMYNMSSSHTHLPATTSTIQLQLCYEVFCFGGGRFVFSTTFSHQKRTELRENFITICLDFYQILYRYFKPMMVFYSIFLAILQWKSARVCTIVGRCSYSSNTGLSQFTNPKKKWKSMMSQWEKLMEQFSGKRFQEGTYKGK